MPRTLPTQNLPIGADESSAPLQQDQETIPRRVEYRPENQREYNNAEKFTLDPKIREDPLFLNILSGMDDLQIAGRKREIQNGHGAEQYAAQSGNEIIMNWISHVQSESENFTKYEYDMNEDTNNGDISFIGYAVYASLLSPKEHFLTKEEVDLIIQSAIDIISFYTELPAFFSTKSTSTANGDESHSGRNR
ncbi:hypothetical protein BOTNAR_0698g00020 [Botryotinia narcissicola]|uniref:Uncharacterized protein n=1 Tax=Botryotinia narcissicola TaxID=278944 RepID=A0A4Z1HJA7_9HELO|nr:hypothetical protein BOTNAR_0698g00020 [Botryotinia narcissicola]